MKRLASILVLLLCANLAYAQSEDTPATWISSILNDEQFSTVEQKNRLTKYNFGPLWTQLDNRSVLGFIGDDYQRLRVKFLSATKSPTQPDTYIVTGKSMVRGVVRAFTGTMIINGARIYKKDREGDEDYTAQKVREHGVVIGEYHLHEDKRQTNTGSFDGLFVTYWYIDRNGRLKYDEIETGADGWLNNQFAGTWTSFRNNSRKRANWGDSRIPLAGDLDIGAGEFSPDERYVANGWQSYQDAYNKQDKRALAEESRQWWR